MRTPIALALLVSGVLLNTGASAAPQQEPLPASDVEVTSADAALTDPTTTAVSIVSGRFSVPELRVPVGGRVAWVNLDPELHEAVDLARGWFGTVFETGPIRPGTAVAVTFQEPGIYRYTCTFHHDQTGVVVVE